MKKPDIVKFTGRTGMTYKELAEKIGKTTGFIGQVASDNSETSVSYDTLLELVKIGLNADELFGEELGQTFQKRCYEDFLAKNNINSVTNNDTIVEGLKTVVNGLNLIIGEKR